MEQLSAILDNIVVFIHQTLNKLNCLCVFSLFEYNLRSNEPGLLLRVDVPLVVSEGGLHQVHLHVGAGHRQGGPLLHIIIQVNVHFKISIKFYHFPFFKVPSHQLRIA